MKKNLLIVNHLIIVILNFKIRRLYLHNVNNNLEPKLCALA